MIYHGDIPVPVYQFRSLARFPQLLHGISTRLGGVSEETHATLNLSFLVGDKPENVRTNRNRLCHTLGCSHHALITAQQVHGTTVATLTEEQWLGSDEDIDFPAFPATDAIVSTAPGAVLLVSLADCASLTLYDPVKRVVGLAHCGWRGTVKGMPRAVVQTMVSVFGCRPVNIRVGIGPSIGPCCYEVGEEVVQAWHDAQGAEGAPAVLTRTGQRFFDLWAANRLQLLQAGITARRIETAALCTACHQETFFSHRASGGTAGRFAALAGLR